MKYILDNFDDIEVYYYKDADVANDTMGGFIFSKTNHQSNDAQPTLFLFADGYQV